MMKETVHFVADGGVGKRRRSGGGIDGGKKGGKKERERDRESKM